MKNVIITILIICLTTMVPISPVQAEKATYESYFNYIEQMPIDAETSYSEEAQGITHDSDNWFISQNEDKDKPKLWKIPKQLNLADTFDCGQFGVQCIYVRATGGLSKYDHVGDIDYYQYNESTGFVLLSLEHSDRAVPPAIALYNPHNLQYIAHAEVHAPQGLPQPENCPWVAVNPANGLVYTTHDDAQGSVWKYQTNWQMLAENWVMTLQYVGNLQFFNESGKPFAVGGQGGVFSESGELFYNTNGGVSYDAGRDGIHVFDMQTKRRIARSPVTGSHPLWYFWFPAHWGECEPEGLTIWDLDKDKVSSHSGQLHVMLLNNDWPSDDNIYVFHYTSRIYVNKDNTGGGAGKPDNPFNTVTEANNLAWNGARISIKAGTYAESLTFSKRIQVLAEGGTVIIGS